MYNCFIIVLILIPGEKKPEGREGGGGGKDQGLLKIPGRRREETRRIPGEKKPEETRGRRRIRIGGRR